MSETFIPAGGAFLIEDTDPNRVFTPEEFTPEDRLMGKTADDFLRKEALPQTERIERGDHALMRELMQKAGELGLLAADVPEVYGGLGLKNTVSALIAEKINWQQSFALTHEAHTVIGTLPLLFFGEHEQKAKYLPKLASGEWVCCFALSEANSGSDALAMQTRAVLAPDGTHYVLNGTKMWITNTAFAQLFTVFARTEDGQYAAFLVERDFPGVSFGKEEHKLGMHGTSTRRVILDSVKVPAENAFALGKGHYAAFCALNMGRFKLEAGAVGGLKETLAVCTAYAKQRKTFGKPIAEYGMIQHKLAEMCARTFALESMVYRLAGYLDRAFEGIVPDAPDASPRYHRAAEEYAIECSIVKVIGSETYSHMTDEAIQIHGGYGYTEEFPVARAWRDQRLLRIGEGANEIVRVLIITTLLRRSKQGRLPVVDAGLRTVQAMVHAEVPEPPLYDDPLDEIRDKARDCKRLALFLLHQAHEKLGDELPERQEIGAAIADIVCAAYAIESVWLRLWKMRNRSAASLAPPAPQSWGETESALLAAQVAARDYADEALHAARYALNSLPGMEDAADWRDEPFTGLGSLLDRLHRWDASPMQLRRDLAARVIAKEGYLW